MRYERVPQAPESKGLYRPLCLLNLGGGFVLLLAGKVSKGYCIASDNNDWVPYRACHGDMPMVRDDTEESSSPSCTPPIESIQQFQHTTDEKVVLSSK